MKTDTQEIACVAGTSAISTAAMVAVFSAFDATITVGGVALLLFASVALGLATLLLTEKWVKASMVAMLPAFGVVFSNILALNQIAAS